ncbi:MAG: hypothetical protein MZW92_28350 [Comamonadaceae bacterium]|nr:hypothetical protein [Comamonadaceae bacterium]
MLDDSELDAPDRRRAGAGAPSCCRPRATSTPAVTLCARRSAPPASRHVRAAASTRGRAPRRARRRSTSRATSQRAAASRRRPRRGDAGRAARRVAAAAPASRSATPTGATAKAAALARLRAAGYAAARLERHRAPRSTPTRHAARLFAGRRQRPAVPHRRDRDRRAAAPRRRQTVRHLAGFAPGTPVTETLLLDYQERLQQAGPVRRAPPSTLDADPARADAAPVLVRAARGAAAGLDRRRGRQRQHRAARVAGARLPARASATRLAREQQVRARAACAQAWDGEISTHPGERFYRNLLGRRVERAGVRRRHRAVAARCALGRTQDTQRARAPDLRRGRALRAQHRRPASVCARHDGAVGQLPRRLARARQRAAAHRAAARSRCRAASAALARQRDASARPVRARRTGASPATGRSGAAWYGRRGVELGQVFARDARRRCPTRSCSAPAATTRCAATPTAAWARRSTAPSAAARVLFTGSVELARPISRQHALGLGRGLRRRRPRRQRLRRPDARRRLRRRRALAQPGRPAAAGLGLGPRGARLRRCTSAWGSRFDGAPVMTPPSALALATPQGGSTGRSRSGGPAAPVERPGHWPGAACKAIRQRTGGAGSVAGSLKAEGSARPGARRSPPPVRHARAGGHPARWWPSLRRRRASRGQVSRDPTPTVAAGRESCLVRHGKPGSGLTRPDPDRRCHAVRSRRERVG